MKPVYDEISFLHSLCKGMKKGKFQPNLGIRVRDARYDAKKTESQDPSKRLAPPPRETDEQRQRRKAVSLAEIAKMQKLLGMRTPNKKQRVTS